MAGMIPRSTLDQIRAASDIVDVIGAVLPLKRAGSNFRALCPFHKEKTPSFHVNPHRQIFHCFGCGKGGDVFRFLQEYEALSFYEAVKRLADRAGIPVEFEQGDAPPQARAVKDKLLQIHEQLAQRWQTALLNDAAGQMARDYLAHRGVSPEAVQLFRLGYAPDNWDDTVSWAKSKGFDLALVEQGGLVRKRESGEGYYSWFRGRLMFPICDEQGRVVAFSARVLKPDDPLGKYVNSPETPIFTKGRVFYGLDKSKRAILEAGFALVCEGQLDLIACYMAGVQNVVAPQGTAFTADHARILKRYVDEVVLCFDSDTAGQKAAVRVLDSLLASGLAIRVATMPAPHDPDSFIKTNGGEAFRELVAQAEGFFDFYLKLLCKTHDTGTDRGRLTVLRDMAEAVLKTGSAVLLDTYAQKTAQRLGVSAESVRAEFKKSRGCAQATPIEDRVAPEAPPEIPPPSEREFWLMRFLLMDEDHTGWVAQHLDLEWLQHPIVRQVVEARLRSYRTETWHDVSAFLAELETDEARRLVTEAVAVEHSRDGLAEKIAESIRLLRNDAIDRKLAQLTLRLDQPSLPESEWIAIEQEKARLRAAKRQSLPGP
jgi:DNA primase